MTEASQRRQVLLVTRNLPPLRGGMERLNLHLVEELAAAFDVTVIGPVGCRAFLPAGVAVVEVPAKPLWKFGAASAIAAWRRARTPLDVAIAGSGLAVPMALIAARRARAKAIAYVHGLDIIAPNRLYRSVWGGAMRRLDAALANSANTRDLAVRAGVAAGNVHVLHPGVALPAVSALPDGDAFRWRIGCGTGPILLSVGRLTPRKGLQEFIRHALPVIVAAFPDARLVVIGDDAQDALLGRDPGQSDRLASLVQALGLQRHVIRLGPCDEETLGQAYAAADVHVFPVQQRPGDIEGFGMVAIEAAAHGLPTVAFAVGGVPDAVGDGLSGFLVKPGDHAQFAARVCELLSGAHPAASPESARAFASSFAWARFGQQMRDAVSAVAREALVQPEGRRRGHAVLDLQSRDAKARKIERLLSLTDRLAPLRLLEVGAGSGGIAHYFANARGIPCDVDAVDVQDVRQLRDGYRFTQVEGTRLPFPDAAFDVVISNHVLEHVGGIEEQRAHLAELRRVLAPGGVGYLAVPSRWQVVEPHYRLAFLSWLPPRWRSRYLRLRRRGVEYDCSPPGVGELEAMLRHAGFAFEQQHAKAIHATFELENPAAFLYRRVLRPTPDWAYRLMRRAMPTLIYVLHDDDASHG